MGYVRAAAATAILAVMVLALPVQLDRASDGSSGDDCLTLADRPLPPNSAALVPTFERCRTVAAGDAVLLADLGAAYAAAGRANDAERAYRDAIAADPDYANAHVSLAAALADRGERAEARVHAEAALRLQPNRAAIVQLLAAIDGGRRATGPP